jgi:hypothetical protein
VRFRNSGTTEARRIALAAFLAIAACRRQAGEAGPSGTPSVTPAIAAPTPTGETPSVKGEVPPAILEPILKEATALAKVGRDQLVVARAESVIWNDGSLGCPEPGMMYTQALVNGYWIVIGAAGRKYDFRVGSEGGFRLCPPGQGHPPSEASTK